MYKALEAEDVDGLTRVYFDMGNVVKYGKRDVIFDLVRLGFDYDNEQTRKGMNILVSSKLTRPTLIYALTSPLGSCLLHTHPLHRFASFTNISSLFSRFFL